MSEDAVVVGSAPEGNPVTGYTGHYLVTVSGGGDHVVQLSGEQAARWATRVARAAATAEYDAAVARQHAAMPEAASERAQQLMVVELRKVHGEGVARLDGLRLTPGVSAFTGDAFLRIDVEGEPGGQWTPDDARSHAEAVLEVIAIVRLDEQYLDVLERVIGLDRGTAMAVVSDLGRHRTT